MVFIYWINTIILTGNDVPSNLVKHYKEFFNLYGLKQLIQCPTRISCNSPSLLDHILTNSSEKASQYGIIDVGLSDHQLIYLTRKITRIKLDTHKQINFRSFKKYSPNLFESALKNVNFPNYETFTDIDTAYSDFMSKLMAVVNNIAPLKTARIKNTSQEWFDGEVAEKIALRDRLFKKFKKSKLQIDRDIYVESRNHVQNLINLKKRTHYEEKLKENIGKPKELWKTLKSLGLPSKTSTASKICIEENDKISFDALGNTEIFKTFFSNLAGNLLNKLPPASLKFGMASVSTFYKQIDFQNKLVFEKISNDSILKILKKIEISKAAGIDNLPGVFLRDGANVLATPVAQICNLSITLSSFPKKCKIAKLKPLYKKGSKTDPKNYRPISLLPLISKILERVIHDQTQNFLLENNVLYKLQSGFRSNHSTDFCLSLLNDKILKGFDTGLITGMILIDLQKAFDTIDHRILLNKMKYLNFSVETISWFESYLTGRTFIVNIENSESQPGRLDCGVPQGSILGPLLFLLYVNDMPQAIKCELLLYADDSCLVFQHKDINEIEKQLNHDFYNICDWFVDNKLSIHFGEDKTKSILFTSKNKIKKVGKLNITFGETQIKQHSKVTYLGCVLDETLSGESMASKVITKINSKLKFLYRKNRFLTPELRRMLCNAIIQPHLDYACSAWYPNLSKKSKDKIQIIQNKCIRFCLQLDKRTHIGIEHFEKINWLNINHRFYQCLNSSIYKFFNNKCPAYMADMYNPVGPREY